MLKILVTGTAGFIGWHLAGRLLARGDAVVGIDSVNDYYDVSLKHARLGRHGIDGKRTAYGQQVVSSTIPRYSFTRVNLEDRPGIERVFEEHRFDVVCHLAAQAGVRYSLSNPRAYIDSNITGFLNIIESCRQAMVSHLVYASSSSVYGLNEQMPFSERAPADHPVSLYAATKKSNELMAHAYSHLFGIPSTGLRFFTVYGPWGRPDMALYLFTKALFAEEPIRLYNEGLMKRDFTYISDTVEGIVRVIDNPPSADPTWTGRNTVLGRSSAPWRVYNVGNSSPVALLDFVAALEQATGRTARKQMLPMQPGDVPATWADTSDMQREFGYRPVTSVQEGIRLYVDWFRSYYKPEEGTTRTGPEPGPGSPG